MGWKIGPIWQCLNMAKKRAIPVKWSKLGREKSHGFAHGRDFIELDQRLHGKKLLEILLHESLHIELPHLTEGQVERVSIRLTHTLWRQGFRRVDNTQGGRMQDGSV